MEFTAYHARYYANEITCRQTGLEGISQTLFDAKVDLNPHQIDAALFALQNPLQEGVLLADEVGLGKTIEAGLVLCQRWAEHQRRLIIACPAVLSKQWETELSEKFALPCLVVDRLVIKKSGLKPGHFFKQHIGKYILILSHQFAVKCETYFVAENWDLVVIDEAHKFRNVYRKNNQMGQALRRMFSGRKKLLLTATPLQNSLMELYGLSTLLDEYLFGDEKQFRKNYVRSQDLDSLRLRLKSFVKRTLRKQVLEYIRYTQRKTITQTFDPTDQEQALYEAISTYLQKETLYALPKRSRHLTTLILRKLLASSPKAILETLTKIRERLQKMQQNQPLVEFAEMDLFSELNSDDIEWEREGESEEKNEFDQHQLSIEIAEIDRFIADAQALQQDSKALALLEALNVGFDQMQQLGAKQKAIIFTESTRTQNYLLDFLNRHGYSGKLVAFSGTNNQPESTQIYQQWQQENRNSERITGSVEVDKRTALIDYFREKANIMIATEAASEGVNLQFCALLINYDLPWNPQRVEQRIGRCHRYGQKFDVVVINFLNQRNQADKRVLQLLTQKFHLFNGVFGASDEILGKIENGVDIEKQILQIYQTCRTEGEIQSAFDTLQHSLEGQISETLAATTKKLFDSFDQDVLERLKISVTERLNQVQQWVWRITQFSLKTAAVFNQQDFSFYLHYPPMPTISTGRYYFLQHQQEKGMIYRLNHALGEWCLEQSLSVPTPNATLIFHYDPQRDGKISLLENYLERSGWLRIDKMSVKSEVQLQEKLIFTACDNNGEWLDAEFCRKLLRLPAIVEAVAVIPPTSLEQTAHLRLESEINRLADENTQLEEQEIERLERWAEDLRSSIYNEIEQLKAEIEAHKRQSRFAQNLEEKHKLQLEIRRLEVLLRNKRRDSFDMEDKVMDERDMLIEQIRLKLQQYVYSETLFCICWQLA